MSERDDVTEQAFHNPVTLTSPPALVETTQELVFRARHKASNRSLMPPEATFYRAVADRMEELEKSVAESKTDVAQSFVDAMLMFSGLEVTLVWRIADAAGFPPLVPPPASAAEG